MNSGKNRDPAKQWLEERLEPGADALDLFLYVRVLLACECARMCLVPPLPQSWAFSHMPGGGKAGTTEDMHSHESWIL